MNFIEFSQYLKVINWIEPDQENPMDSGRRLVNYEPYDFQKRLIKHLHNNKHTILKKSRNGGFSTTIVLYLLWRCLYISNQKILLISKTDREARWNSNIAKIALDNLPEKPEMETNNDHFKKFTNTSSTMSFFNITGVRGFYANTIFVDEAAFIPDMNSHWKAITPAFHPNGKDIINYQDYIGFIEDIENGSTLAANALIDYLIDEDKTIEAEYLKRFTNNLPEFLFNCCPTKFCNMIVCSTPNGKNNWFANMYNDAINEENDFSIFESSYTENPRIPYKNSSYEALKNNLGDKGWRQEILTEFI